MASQEHLQQLMNDEADDSSSHSSSSSNTKGGNDKAFEEQVSTTLTPKFKLPIHPKKRIRVPLKVSLSFVQTDASKDEDENKPSAGAKRSLPMSIPKRPTLARPLTPPAQRQRLNKRSLPIKKKKKVNPVKKEDAGGEYKAMVVDSDDGGEDDAVATALVEPTAAATPTAEKNSVHQHHKKKSTNLNHRGVRLPPFSSPGLLVPISHSISIIKGKPSDDASNSTLSSAGLTSMASVFDQYLTILGCTEETRTKRPHIGSSVKMQVGDMFDSDVHTSAQFPKLVPEDLIPSAKDANEDTEFRFSLALKLIDAFEVKSPDRITSSRERPQELSRQDKSSSSSEAPRKRQKLKSWTDMAPLSLTLPYPKSYLQKRMDYVEQVNERELAILTYKKEVEAFERAHPELSEEHFHDNHETMEKPNTVVPPIPTSPSPPQLSELTTLDKSEFMLDSQHPIYLPKSKDLVAHLDKESFHITKGRYFGLSCNRIADPHFVGPVAPGITGLNLTASNGLATAQAGGGTLNVGGFPSQSSMPNASINKSSYGKKSSSHIAAPSTPAVTKKKKKKPAITLSLNPVSTTKKASETQ